MRGCKTISFPNRPNSRLPAPTLHTTDFTPCRQVLREQIGKLQEGLATERIAREAHPEPSPSRASAICGPLLLTALTLAIRQMLEERKTKELKLVESSVMIDLNVEKQVSLPQ